MVTPLDTTTRPPVAGSSYADHPGWRRYQPHLPERYRSRNQASHNSKPPSASFLVAYGQRGRRALVEEPISVDAGQAGLPSSLPTSIPPGLSQIDTLAQR